MSRADIIALGDHYPVTEFNATEYWVLVFKLDSEPNGDCYAFTTRARGSATPGTLLTSLDYTKIPSAFDGEDDHDGGGCLNTKCWKCDNCASEWPTTYTVDFSGIEFHSPARVPNYYGEVTTFEFSNVSAFNDEFTLLMRAWGWQAENCAWYADVDIDCTCTITPPGGEPQTWPVRLRIDLQPQTDAQPWGLFVSYSLYDPETGVALPDYGGRYPQTGNAFIKYFDVPDGCCVTSGTINNDSQSGPMYHQGDEPEGWTHVQGAYFVIASPISRYYPIRRIYNYSPPQHWAYAENVSGPRMGFGGTATLTPGPLVDDEPCAIQEPDEISSWSSASSAGWSSDDATSIVSSLESIDSVESINSSVESIDSSADESADNSGSDSGDGGDSGDDSDSNPWPDSWSSDNPLVVSSQSDDSDSSGWLPPFDDFQNGFRGRWPLGNFAPVPSEGCICDYSGATASIADADSPAPTSTASTFCSQPAFDSPCVGDSEFCWFSGRKLEHAYGGTTSFIHTSPVAKICTRSFPFYTFAGAQSDDVVVMIGEHENVAQLYSGAIGDPVTIRLPDSAIIFRNTRGYVIGAAGTVEKRFVSASGLASYVYPAGSSTTNWTGGAADLEDGGFATRTWADGVSAGDLVERGWVDGDGIANVKFVLIVSGAGDCLIPAGSIRGTDTPPTGDVCDLSNVPDVLRAQIHGVTGEVCADQNGAFELARIGNEWRDGADRWRLYCRGSGIWHLEDLQHDCAVPSSTSSDSTPSSLSSASSISDVECCDTYTATLTGDESGTYSIPYIGGGVWQNPTGFYGEPITITSPDPESPFPSWSISFDAGEFANAIWINETVSDCPPLTGWVLDEGNFGGSVTLECDIDSTSSLSSTSTSSDSTPTWCWFYLFMSTGGCDGEWSEVFISGGGDAFWLPSTTTTSWEIQPNDGDADGYTDYCIATRWVSVGDCGPSEEEPSSAPPAAPTAPAEPATPCPCGEVME